METNHKNGAAPVREPKLNGAHPPASYDPQSARRLWMSVLARASLAEIEELTRSLKLPAYEIIKQPETGTVMVEGRAGGSGLRFNLGEATATRAVVRLADGTLGFSYALGRDMNKALLAAVLDGMLQGSGQATALHAQVIAPLQARQMEAKASRSRKAAATKVEFFTLVRGEER